MNTFWLKIAGLAVGVAVIIIVASNFLSEEVDEALEPEKTFSDQVEQDRKNFLAEPEEVKLPPDQQTGSAPEPPVDESRTRPVKVVSAEEMAAIKQNP